MRRKERPQISKNYGLKFLEIKKRVWTVQTLKTTGLSFRTIINYLIKFITKKHAPDKPDKTSFTLLLQLRMHMFKCAKFSIHIF